MNTSIIPFYLSKYAHSMRRLCQGVLVLALLLGNSGQVYSQECHAIYSAPNGFGKLDIPCLESNDGNTYQATLSQVPGVFLFQLNLTPVTYLPVGAPAKFDSATGTLFIPIVNVSLGGNTNCQLHRSFH